MNQIKFFVLAGLLLVSSFAHALIINGKGFQQRGFRFEQSANAVELVPMGTLPEVVLVGKQQILSLTLERRLRAPLVTSLLIGGVAQQPSRTYAGRVDLYVISEANGKNAKLVFIPVGSDLQLPHPYVLSSESLGSVDIREGLIQPFKDLGGGNFLYTFPVGQDGFYDVTKEFSLVGRVPQNMGSAKVEFRLRLSANMSKAGWIVLRMHDDQEVLRLYVPQAARSGQIVSIVREVPRLTGDKNFLNVVNVGVPLSEFKFRILELKTTRSYSER